MRSVQVCTSSQNATRQGIVRYGTHCIFASQLQPHGKRYETPSLKFLRISKQLRYDCRRSKERTGGVWRDISRELLPIACFQFTRWGLNEGLEGRLLTGCRAALVMFGNSRQLVLRGLQRGARRASERESRDAPWSAPVSSTDAPSAQAILRRALCTAGIPVALAAILEQHGVRTRPSRPSLQ